jgi:hypothetical protein
MSSPRVYSAIRGHLEARWTATPLAWENEAFTPPELAPWVAVEVTGTLYSQASIGADDQASNRWDETGLVFLHVFVPTGTGTAVARQHCRALADTFRGLVLDEGALEFGDASIGMGAPGDDEGTTYRISVSVDWRRMEA